MSYRLTFDDDFYSGGSTNVSDTPTSVEQALISMENWDEMIEDMGYPDSLEAVMEIVMETDTSTNLNSPVEVWIDPDGFYTIFVY